MKSLNNLLILTKIILTFVLLCVIIYIIEQKKGGYVVDIWKNIQAALTVVGGAIGYFLGGLDGLLIVLLAFMVIDYITGIMCAIKDKSISSKVGFSGICKKILILVLVGMSNLLDIYVLQTGSMLRTAALFFYISNEGVSILENAGKLGLPIPAKIKNVLAQLHDKAEDTSSNTDDKADKA